MVLTPEREEELIVQNMPKIYRSVDNFMARCNQNSAVRISYDDCVQEVSIAFLKYMRKCETEEQINKFPWYDALHALSELVLRSQPLSVPVSSTKEFSNIIHSIPATVSFDVLASSGIDINGMSKHWVPDTETKLDFFSFMSEQEENVQRIASMSMYGLTRRKIAAQFGVNKNVIDKKISKLREQYDNFMKEGDGDE